MLPSLQDIPGLLPGGFHRGDAAAVENAGRGNGRALGHERGHRPHADHSDRGHHGRDSLRLSPEARAAQARAAEERESVGDAVAAETDGKSLLGAAGGFVRQALETIRHDLGKALKSFGFDSAAVENFSQAFIEPVLAALKEGVNFTAELSFAAFRQVTATSAGGVSQSTSLVAQSLSIDVNQDTGEVSVSLAKLSFEQQLEIRSGNGPAPLLVLDPDDVVTPAELAQKILDSGIKPVAGPDGAADAQPVAAVPEGEEPAAPAPAAARQEELAALREKIAEDAVKLQTRLTIYAVSYHKNDKGESITRLLLDAQLRIDGLNNDAPVQEEAQSLDLEA
jgi:hypothetical protein